MVVICLKFVAIVYIWTGVMRKPGAGSWFSWACSFAGVRLRELFRLAAICVLPECRLCVDYLAPKVQTATPQNAPNQVNTHTATG